MIKKLFVALTVFCVAMMTGFSAIGADFDLAKSSTLEGILKKGQLRVGFEAGYTPFEMVNRKGAFIGFDIDVAKEMAEAMGVKLVLVNTAWDGIIPALETNKFDIIISAMTVTQERNLKVNFADPYIIVGQTILVNNKHKGKINSYKDLNSPKYIVTSKLGTTGEKAVKRYIPNCTYKSFETQVDAGMEVINGSADAFIYDLPFCESFFAAHGKNSLYHIDKPFTYEPLAWALKKGDPDFLNWLNNFLRQIKNDGRYEMFYNKWIRSTAWQKEIEE
jgi:polar amino acid transport system substrate-binding protein